MLAGLDARQEELETGDLPEIPDCILGSSARVGAREDVLSRGGFRKEQGLKDVVQRKKRW